ncbi:unnamed protein product [Symbiodinium pilosum]|uniref:Uncharacterized protein n=1 Tax=Symbiodinium pilosum TaxID=2952 RepID=A0A812MZM5_SYMPI|nr:unnamed protein product [Symbiodinium pilosum]
MGLCHLATLLPAVLALRQAEEGGRGTLCCVSSYPDLGVQSSEFQKEAEKVLEDVAYTGAYYAGPKRYHSARFRRHCKDALHLKNCPSMDVTFMKIYEHVPLSDIESRIDSFLTTWHFHSESYWAFAGECPGHLQRQKEDPSRCSEDLGHFMRMLELWKDGLKYADEVKKNSGFRGWLKDKKSKALAEKKLENIMAELDALW